jgi:hypothetical protein
VVRNLRELTAERFLTKADAVRLIREAALADVPG